MILSTPVGPYGGFSSHGRLRDLKVHGGYLKNQLAKLEKDGTQVGKTELDNQMQYVTDEIRYMNGIMNDPKGHLVVVQKSRKVVEGSVGRCIYSDKDRGHARVEFSSGDQVSCSFNNVDVIDFPPLPAFIPAPGYQVRSMASGSDYIAVEWKSYLVMLCTKSSILQGIVAGDFLMVRESTDIEIMTEV